MRDGEITRLSDKLPHQRLSLARPARNMEARSRATDPRQKSRRSRRIQASVGRQSGELPRYNGPGRRRGQFAAVHLPHGLEEDVQLCLFEFAQVERHDSVLVVREDRERKAKRSLTELRHGVEPVLFAHQQRDSRCRFPWRT